MAEIKQAKFIDQTGQEKDAVFIGAEKAIYDDSGKRLDQKMEERKKASGLLATDTQGVLGSAGTEVSMQAIIDKVAEKIMKELVSNSSLTQTLANYITKAMMSNQQVNDQNKVPTSALAYAMQQVITKNQNDITQLNSDLRNPASINGSLLEYAKTVTAYKNVFTGGETTDIPSSAKYSIAHIEERNGTYFISILGTDGKIYTNYCSASKSWIGWYSSNMVSVK